MDGWAEITPSIAAEAQLQGATLEIEISASLSISNGSIVRSKSPLELGDNTLSDDFSDFLFDFLETCERLKSHPSFMLGRLIGFENRTAIRLGRRGIAERFMIQLCTNERACMK
jgi:hypothetical protein